MNRGTNIRMKGTAARSSRRRFTSTTFPKLLSCLQPTAFSLQPCSGAGHRSTTHG
jgi:hypothetical protein